ncbi:MAG: MlaD family protein [Planctomycetaceae bacterium]|nr:MlaD family protein [Planctomycetaceae bacterium]
MKESARNVAVGITVIVAMLILAGMILIFAGLPVMVRSGYTINMIFPSTADAHTGDPVHLSGLKIGEVTDIDFAGGDSRKGVMFTALIYSDVKIPGNAEAFIYSRGLAGGAYIQLKGEGSPRIDPRTGQPMDYLPTTATPVLTGHLKTSLLPEEVEKGFVSISRLAESLNALVSPQGPATGGAASTRPSTTAASQAGLQGTIARMNEALDNFNGMVSKKNQESFSGLLVNLSNASLQASKALVEIQQATAKISADSSHVSRGLLEDTSRLSALLAELEKTVHKVNEGDGSMAKLLNDPKFYNNLVDASDQANKLMEEMRLLAKDWKDNGVKMKLK